MQNSKVRNVGNVFELAYGVVKVIYMQEEAQRHRLTAVFNMYGHTPRLCVALFYTNHTVRSRRSNMPLTLQSVDFIAYTYGRIQIST